MKLAKLTVASLLLVGSCLGYASDKIYTVKDIPVLKQEEQHQIVTERVTSRFTRMHYRKVNLDDEFATKIFERYLHLLDYNHNILLQSDVDQYQKYKTVLAEELKSGDLSKVYEIFNQVQIKRFERLQYALTLLNKPMDFSKDESIDFNRDKKTWPKTSKELDELWRLRVKFDELSLSLAGKKEQEIRDILHKRYTLAIKRLTQIHSEDVFQVIMNAFAREIDPHTSYLSPRITKQFNSEMSLSLEGIGAVLRAEDDYTVIASLIKGGPAERNGTLKAGDRIIAVGQDGKSMEDVVGWRLDDIVEKIKGPKGTKIYLDILPAGLNTKIKHITLTRDKVHLEDSAAKLTEKKVNGQKVAVITIPSFYMGLSDNVKRELMKVKKDRTASVVIDLRNNGGGSLVEAIALSGLFIPKGPVVQVRDNLGNIQSYSSDIERAYYTGPLVILVNRDSASASEIFSASMQDYGRALIVGEPTFGKGTVQTHSALNSVFDKVVHPSWADLGAVQYTIQKFYRINGGSTQLKGVEPDILMPTAKLVIDTGERFEDNALPWDSIPAAQYRTLGNPKKALVSLTALHEARIAHSKQFSFIFQDIKEYEKRKSKRDIVSLNKEKREKENKENDVRRLLIVNENLKEQGKSAIKSLDDLPKDYKASDPYLDETVLISLDYASSLKNK